jgi:hypothetical protein
MGNDGILHFHLKPFLFINFPPNMLQEFNIWYIKQKYTYINPKILLENP